METQYLLDTHIFLWALQDPDRLSAKQRKILENPEALLYFSHVSLWELVIKTGLGRLQFTNGLKSAVERGMLGLRAGYLPVRIEHLWRLGELPNHHRDPFDRLLAAQALSEKLRLITADPAFKKYRVRAV